MASNRPSIVLGGRYELTAVLARGGQSTVYRARDRVDGDEVAVKVVHGAAGDPDGMERCFREAQSLALLLGTAAVRILHQVRTEDGGFALVMELLEGEELEARLRAMEARGERPSFEWIDRTLGPIVETLEAAHARGLVHRDVKAANVFLVDPARGGGVRLLDFGFVKLLRAPTITGSEVVAGSPEYIAPETFTRGAWAADARSDVYSLGVVLFRTIAGVLPFRGALVEIMQGATAGARPSLHALRPEMSPSVDGWVQHALAIDPAERFQSVTASWRALRGCFPRK